MIGGAIFYSFRIHNKTGPKTDSSHREIKDRVIHLLNGAGMVTHEIVRPEIYKHDISFNFLPDFRKGAIHLIFKPFEYIRILKNAYNISVVSWEFDTINAASQNDLPFTNHTRMLSLLDEIWLISNRQRNLLTRHHFLNTFLISQDPPDSGISRDKIIDRIRSIKGMKDA